MSHLNSVSCFDWIWHHLFYYLLKKKFSNNAEKQQSEKNLRCRTKKVILTLLKTLLWISLKKIELHLVFFSQCLKIKAYTNQKQKEKTKFCAFCFHKLLFSLYNAVSCIFFWQLETSSNKLDICFVLRNSRKRQFFLYQNSSRLVTSPTIIRSGQS